MSPFLAILLGAGLGSSIGGAPAPTSAGIETSNACQPGWLPTFGGRPGVDDAVDGLFAFDDGSGPALYARGSFDVAGGVPVQGLARWDGTSWTSVGEGLTLGGRLAFAAFDDGSGAGEALYAGGASDPATGDSIARWDGTSWSPFGLGPDSHVRALAVFDDGSGPALYAGGQFTSAGSVPAANLARWDGASWSAVTSGTNGFVSALAVHDDGSGPALFVAGSFTLAGGVSVANAARWDGSTWSPVGSLNDAVNAFAVFDDGGGPALYAGGEHTIADGNTVDRVSRWNGSTWSALGTGMDGRVTSLAVLDAGTGDALYACGSFHLAGGGTVDHVARWDGTSWSALAGGVEHDAYSLAVADLGSGPELFVGGAFRDASGVQVDFIGRWSGSSWSALDGGMSRPVRSLAVFDDGSGPGLYAGGEFLSAGGTEAWRVARWDGGAWSPLGLGVDGSPAPKVSSLAVCAVGGGGPALFAGGDFTVAGGGAASRIARWDGTAWSPLGSGIWDGAVSAMIEFDDGGGPALHAAGDLQMAAGVLVNGIARWDGGAWSSLGSGVQGGWVESLAVHDDGTGPALYAGGQFSAAGGSPATCIARWDGTSWSQVGSGLDGGFVWALTEFDDGSGGGPDLYAGGSFTSSGGQPLQRVARWDGTTWSPLGSGIDDALLGVHALAVFDDGSGGGPALHAAGTFSSAGGAPAANIARWDGTSWTSLGSGTNGSVEALIVFDDGSGAGPSLVAAGTFTSALDSQDSFLARWGGCSAPQPGTAFCSGDGSGAACPCGNTGAPGHGCANPAGTGVRLAATGDVGTNSVVLVGSGYPPAGSPAAIVIRGTNAATTPSVFGDGLLCIDLPVVRLAARTASAGKSVHPIGHGAAPGTYHYQLWYRSTGSFCPPHAFNLSNGYTIAWP